MKALLLTFALSLFAAQSFAQDTVLKSEASCVSNKKAFHITSLTQTTDVQACAQSRSLDKATDACVNKYGRVLQGDSMVTGCTKEIIDVHGSLMMHVKCTARAAVLCSL